MGLEQKPVYMTVRQYHSIEKIKQNGIDPRSEYNVSEPKQNHLYEFYQ